MNTRSPAAVDDDQSTVVLTVVPVVLVDVHCGCLRGGACDTQCGATKAGRVTAIPVASPRFSARTMPIAAADAAERLRSGGRPSAVMGPCSAMTPPRRGRVYRSSRPMPALNVPWRLPVGRASNLHQRRNIEDAMALRAHERYPAPIKKRRIRSKKTHQVNAFFCLIKPLPLICFSFYFASRLR